MTLTRRRIWVACAAAGAVVIALAAWLIVGSTSGAAGEQAASALGVPVTIPVGEYPRSVVVTPDGRRVLVHAEAGLLVLDTATNAVLGTINVSQGGTPRGNVLLSPDGKRVYLRMPDGIESVDLTTGLIGDMIVADTIAGIPSDFAAISPDGNLLVGTSPGQSSELSLLDLTTRTARQIPLLSKSILPTAVFSPDGSRIYVAPGSGPLQVIDVATGAASPVPGVEYASSVATAPGGTSLYVGAGGNVAVLDPATGAVIRSVHSSPVGPFSSRFVVSPGGRYLYGISYRSDGVVEALDSESGAVVGTVPVGEDPRELALTPDGGKLYVLSDAGLTMVPITGGA